MGKEYMYKGKGYQLDALSKFCPPCVSKSNLSQRICVGKFGSIEEAVDTPKVNHNSRKPKQRRMVEPKNKIDHHVQTLFWAKKVHDLKM